MGKKDNTHFIKNLCNTGEPKVILLTAILPWFVLAMCAVGLIGVYHYTEEALSQKKLALFETQIAKIKRSVVDRFRKYDSVFRGYEGLFAILPEIDRSAWRRYNEKLDLNLYPGLIALGYIESPGQPDTSHPPYKISFFQFGDLIDLGEGLDLGQDESLRQRMNKARDSGKVQISRKFIFKDADEKEIVSNYYFLPIYRSALPTSTVAEKRLALRGWIFGIFDYARLLDDLVVNPSRDIDYEIYDKAEMTPEALLYKDHDQIFALDPFYRPAFSEIFKFRRWGRGRTIYFSSNSDFESIVDSSILDVISVGGGMFLFALSALIVSLSTMRSRALNLARKITQDLRLTTTLQKAVLDSANYAIIAAGQDGIIQTFNKGAEKLLRYTAQEVVGKEALTLFHDDEELMNRVDDWSLKTGREPLEGFEALVAKAKSLKAADEREWTYVRKDGTRLIARLSLTPLYQEDDNISGYLSVGYDATEEKKIERFKNEFVSMVSHEIRTPLTSIRGTLGLLNGGLAGELPKKASSLVDIALQNCERLSRLIDDILDVEKIEAGKFDFNLESLDLGELLKRAVEINKFYSNKFGVRFQIEKIPENVWVASDADRLMQVIANLLSNAAKFSPAGGFVRIGLEKRQKSARVWVSDRGPGIPESFENRIFQKFAQADSSDTRQKSGSGLGLSISKMIIEKLGGRIDYHSEAGAGSTFYFDLPLTQKKQSPREAENDDGTLNRKGAL